MSDLTAHTVYRRLSDKDIRWFAIEKLVVAGSLAFAGMLILFAFSVFFFGGE